MDNYTETLREAKNNLNQALSKAKLLSPSVRRRVVDNIDLGYLLQSNVTVNEQDWSAYADGTDSERQTLKDIGNKFYPMYLNL